MFGELFYRECGRVARGVLYWMSIALMLLMYFSQMGTDAKSLNYPLEPKPGQESYGSKSAENPETIMPMATQRLLDEYRANSYACYPFGFYKSVRLSGEKQAEIAAILGELTGEEIAPSQGGGGAGSLTVGDSENDLSIRGGEGKVTIQYPDGSVTEHSPDELPEGLRDSLGAGSGGAALPENQVGVKVGYDRFLEQMERVDALIGGGSSYARLSLIGEFGREPKTYEDALTEYRGFVEKDRVFGAFARQFADYLGIVLAVLPVFAAVSLFLRDRRARAEELLYTRQAPSRTVVLTRFAALAVMQLLPVILLSLLPVAQLIPVWSGKGLSIDYFAYFKYILGWLLPTLLVPTAVGVFFTVLTDTPLAILVQAVWWFADVFVADASGSYGPKALSPFRLAIRHNGIIRNEETMSQTGLLAANRIGYVLFALALVWAAVWLYEQKRRGRFHAGAKLGRLAARLRGKRGIDAAD